jgi:hypothetical protein
MTVFDAARYFYTAPRGAIVFGVWSPDITEFVECVIPHGLLPSTLSIDVKGIASMLGVFADEQGCINPAPPHVQRPGMYLNASRPKLFSD